MKKSTNFQMDLRTGGGAGSELDPRNVAVIGQVLLSCLHERLRLTHGALHGLEVSSVNFVKTLFTRSINSPSAEDVLVEHVC